MIDDDPFQRPRKLTQEQARMEQLLYWSKKTIPERLAGMAALNKQLWAMRGIDLDKAEWDWNPRKVSRNRP